MLVYEDKNLMIVDSLSETVVRWSGPPDHRGMLVFEECWRKFKSDSDIKSRRDLGTLALQAMRKLMVLDDLASI